MTDKHTPGPWVAQPDLFDGYFYIEAASGAVIAEVFPWQAGDMDGAGEADANARLIEAAPELLEALEALIECYTISIERDGDAWRNADDDESIIKARAAITKARGTQ
jgi:hypothetical protein